MNIHVSSIIFPLFLVPLLQTVPAFPPPPGTMKFSENGFIDKNLITYLDYNEFLFSIKTLEPETLGELIPSDTSASYEGEIMWNNPEFENYPILGLTEQQINLYCIWRSEAVNKLIFNPDLRCSNYKYWKKFDFLDPEKKYKVVYSIPSMEELGRARLRNHFPIDEIARDGVFRRHGGKNQSSDRELNGFRCKASYIQAD